VVTGAASCSTRPVEPDAQRLTREQLMKPSACAGCHPDQTREWSGSMHAYAGEDPVFLAMNARMQRETGGKNGDFCVKCHAPMAVRTGATKDGLNLASLPPEMRGVTCFFCHTVDGVLGEHDAALRLGDDTMRGGLTAPRSAGAHASAHSTLHDRERLESAATCGACHDVVTPHGAAVERTFAEWKSSIYARQLACGKCHMPGRDGVAANVPGVPLRRVHDHAMPGVDVALTDFPEREEQRRLVQASLDGALIPKLCVRPAAGGTELEVSLDNAFVGHMWPSGAAQDRRAWVELVAYRGAEIVLESGRIGDHEAVTARPEPDLFLLRDRIFDPAGKETHMFWEAARVESVLLPPSVTNDPRDPRFYHAVTRTYRVAGAPPDRVTMCARIRPIDFDVLDDLVASGDLDGAVRDRVPTSTLASTALEWTSAVGYRCVP